mgnify:CR=1 FL=1
MLLRSDNYENLYLNFRWNIPEFYNIASGTIDKIEYSDRTALINILQDGQSEIWSFLDIKKSANKLANAFDGLGIPHDARVGIILSQCPETAIAHMACFISNGPRCQLKPSFIASSISWGELVILGTRLAA